MNEFAASLQNFILSVADYLPFTLGIIAVLWGVQLINKLLGYRLNYLGIYPRRFFGLIGIPCSPFLHENFAHLLFNSLPLFFLSNLVLLDGYREFVVISMFIVLVGGLLTWLLGREAIHFGSSIVIMGYFGYLVTQMYHHHSLMNIFVVAISIYYFGGLLTALIPGREGVSWEGHVFGFLSGVGAAMFLPQLLTYF